MVQKTRKIYSETDLILRGALKRAMYEHRKIDKEIEMLFNKSLEADLESLSSGRDTGMPKVGKILNKLNNMVNA